MKEIETYFSVSGLYIYISGSVLVLKSCLLLNELSQKLGQILFKSSEHLLAVLNRSCELIQRSHAFRYRAILSAIVVVVVNVGLAETLFQSKSLGEVLNKLNQIGFAVWVCWVVNKNDSLNVLLARGPAFLVFEITAEIPELDINFTELRNACRGISFKVNNSTSGSWSIDSAKTFLESTKDVC